MFPYPQKIANSDEPFRNHSKKMNLAQITNISFFSPFEQPHITSVPVIAVVIFMKIHVII